MLQKRILLGSHLQVAMYITVLMGSKEAVINIAVLLDAIIRNGHLSEMALSLLFFDVLSGTISQS